MAPQLFSPKYFTSSPVLDSVCVVDPDLMYPVNPDVQSWQEGMDHSTPHVQIHILRMFQLNSFRQWPDFFSYCYGIALSGGVGSKGIGSKE